MLYDVSHKNEYCTPDSRHEMLLFNSKKRILNFDNNLDDSNAVVKGILFAVSINF